MDYNLVLSATLIVFTFCFIVLLYFSWQNREIPISISYGLGVLAAALYTFGYAFQLVSVTIKDILFWIHIQYLGIPFAPFIWIIMVLQFTGNQRFLTKRNIALLLMGPLYTLTAHFTNDWHHLFYRTMSLDYSQGFPLILLDRGPLFYLHICYVYSYYLFGIGILIHVYFKSNKERKKQIILMLIGSLFVFGFPFIHSMGLIKIPIDISPFGLIFSSLFYLWGIYQFNMLKLSPLAMKKVFESIKDAVIIFDLDDTLKNYNRSARILFEPLPKKQLLGHEAEEVLAHFPSLLNLLRADLEKSSQIKETLQLDGRFYQVDYSLIEGRRKKSVGKLLILRDITEAIDYERSIIEKSRQFEYLAHHDALTGIYNRAYFEKEVKQKLTLTSEKERAFMICDLNFFKEINDIYGHVIGDYVLAFTANCWRENLPKPHLLARLGGDEFIMFFEQIESKEKLLQQIDDVRQIFKTQLYEQGDVKIEVVPSIGIAFVGEDGTDYETLYHSCDIRMYDDKKRIKNIINIAEY